MTGGLAQYRNARKRALKWDRHRSRRLFEAHLTVANLDASVRSIAICRLEVAYVPRGSRPLLLDRFARKRCWGCGREVQLRRSDHAHRFCSARDVITAPTTLRSAGIALDFDRQPTNEPIVLAGCQPRLFASAIDGRLLQYIAMLGDEPRPDAGVVPWRE